MPPAAVLTLREKGALLDVVLRLGELPSHCGGALEVTLVLGATERALFEGHTIQSMSNDPLAAFLAA